jgi:hypothetical protein
MIRAISEGISVWTYSSQKLQATRREYPRLNRFIIHQIISGVCILIQLKKPGPLGGQAIQDLSASSETLFTTLASWS